MHVLIRRNFVNSAAATSAASLRRSRAFADEPLKVGFVYLGPIGDFGWTWAHEKGRKAMLAALGDKVTADYVENRPRRRERDAGHQGSRRAGPQADLHHLVRLHGPDDDGRRRLPEYDVRALHRLQTREERRHLQQPLPRRPRSRRHDRGHDVEDRDHWLSRLIQVPEVVLGVNAVRAGGPGREPNPNIKVKLVLIDSWFDPSKEAAATESFTNLGCDVVAPAYRQPGRAASLGKEEAIRFRQCRMPASPPHAQLTAIENIWGPYYTSGAQAILDGKWEADDAWWGIKEGAVVMAPYNKALPANVVAASDKVINGYKDGSYDVFTGPIYDQAGALKAPKGEKMSLKDLATIDWYVKGVQS